MLASGIAYSRLSLERKNRELGDGSSYRTTGESCPPVAGPDVAAHLLARCSFHAAGESAERCRATGTAVPIMSSSTRTRPASSSRSRVPTK
jgi:hypothetical protein